MSRGGMRWNAGRPGYRAKAEHLCRVDVRQWARLGYLREGCIFSWRWTVGDEPAGAISVRVHSPDALTLDYTFGPGSDNPRIVAEHVSIERTACPYGSTRPWFSCPRCAQRVAVLYLRRGYFACRHCQRVAYSSQSDDQLDRMWRRQQKIEKRLGGSWRRPKGMRKATYDRLFAKLVDCEERREDAFASAVARLMARSR
jgi:hypothetical protein